MFKADFESIKKVEWQHVRKKVSLLDPTFAKIVDRLDPDKNFPIVIARYPFGKMFVQEGKFFLPLNDGELVSSNDSRIPSDIQQILTYAGSEIPAGMVLHNSIELFVEQDDKTMPWFLYTEGSIFGLWGELDSDISHHPANIFNITTGARSIFMIPNISDNISHNKLCREFGISIPPPKNLNDHWSIFVALNQHFSLQNDWHVELLFFSEKWLEKINSNDKAWFELNRYLLRYAWQKSSYWRNKAFYDFAFSCAQANTNLKPNPYIADTAKHLLIIAVGAAPAFITGIDETAAPIKSIQTAYIHGYKIKEYVPTIMHPSHMSQINNRSHYYSLMQPSTLEFSPTSRRASNMIFDIKELRDICIKYLHEILQCNLKLENTPMHHVAKKLKLDFFHSKPDNIGGILSTKEMVKDDPSLLFCYEKIDKKFADSGTFVRGCVRISSSTDPIKTLK